MIDKFGGFFSSSVCLVCSFYLLHIGELVCEFFRECVKHKTSNLKCHKLLTIIIIHLITSKIHSYI